MKARDWLVYSLILATLAGCGLKRNLSLPPADKQTQTDASGNATPAPAPTPAPTPVPDPTLVPGL